MNHGQGSERERSLDSELTGVLLGFLFKQENTKDQKEVFTLAHRHWTSAISL